jgi:hypothetical protein
LSFKAKGRLSRAAIAPLIDSDLFAPVRFPISRCSMSGNQQRFAGSCKLALNKALAKDEKQQRQIQIHRFATVDGITPYPHGEDVNRSTAPEAY